MLYRIWRNATLPLDGAPPLPYVLVRVNRGALVAHRHTYASPRCRTSQYRGLFISLAVSLLLFSLTLLSVYRWYYGAGVFGLIGCRSLSLSLALPTSFNNNNENFIVGRNQFMAAV